MPEQNGNPTGADATESNGTNVSRRRWLEIAGIAAVSATVPAGLGSADGGENTFSIRSTDRTPAMYYTFAAAGEIESGDDTNDHDVVVKAGTIEREGLNRALDDWRNGTISREALIRVVEAWRSDDTVRDSALDQYVSDEGARWHVEGQVGPNGEDSYSVPDHLEDWTAVDDEGAHVPESEFALYWNGQAVSLAAVLGEQETNTLQLQSTDRTPAMYYTFTAAGEIEKGDDTNDHDVVTRDGSVWRLEGAVGPNGTDTYEVPGKLLEWDAIDADGNYVPETDFGLYWNGEAADLEGVLTGDLPTQRLEIVAPDDGGLEYSFTATKSIDPVFDNGSRSAEDGEDTVAENDDGTWTATGETADGSGDTFDFAGTAEAFEPKEGTFALYLDGEQVTPWELIGEEPPDDPDDPVEGGPIGGGGGYENTVARSAADVVVETLDELQDALGGASAGDVVYVAGDASIDLGTGTYTVPSGVTLASNRGIDDAPGGHLYTEHEPDYHTSCLELEQDARLAGVRVQGPYYEYFSPSFYADGAGVTAQGDDAEVDNCELWGFAYASVVSRASETHVHHNEIHHNPRAGLGYGVSCLGGHPLIEWNYLNANRHSIGSSGEGGYTVRYNYFGPETFSHVIDAHSPGGTRMEIYNNTVEAVEGAQDGDQRPAVAMRGVPEDVATIDDNWFFNPEEPLDSPGGWTDESIIQAEADEWTNVEWAGNHYGSSEPAEDVGHPR